MFGEDNAHQQWELQMVKSSCFPHGLSSFTAFLMWVCLTSKKKDVRSKQKLLFACICIVVHS